MFDRVLSRIGHTSAEDVEDYSQPRYLDAECQASDIANRRAGDPAGDRSRYLEAAALFLAIARGAPTAPDDVEEHYAAIDILSRDIRQYTAAMFEPDMPHARPT